MTCKSQILVLLAMVSTVVALDVDPSFNSNPVAQATVAITVLTSVGFGIGVVIYYLRRHDSRNVDNEKFFTAKDSVSKWSIAWSFYASGIGSWVLTAPPDLGFFTGLISVFAYAIAAGIPAIFIAYFGNYMKASYKDILSLSDFVNVRYGRFTQAMVVVITLFNMGIATAAEYTTISAFFFGYVGLNDFDIFIVLTVALVTLSYTAFGGLPVSIITDKVQAIASVLLVTILTIYILATMKPIPDGASIDFCASGENTTIGEPCTYTFVDQLLGTYEGGYGTIFTLPLSLVCATLFSEAFWQRAWAAEDEAALKKGAVIASLMLGTITFIFGLLGVYGGFVGVTGYDSDSNLRVFDALEGETGQTFITTGWGLLVVVLGVTMSQAALDSLQNGLAASVNGVIAPKLTSCGQNNMIISRIAVVVVNVPLIIIGVQRFSVLGLFLVANMITTCATFPMVLGFVPNDFLNKYHLDVVPPIAFALSLLCLIGYGASKSGGDFVAGASLAFYEHIYEWDFFLVAFSASIGTTMLLIGGIYGLNAVGVVTLPETPGVVTRLEMVNAKSKEQKAEELSA